MKRLVVISDMHCGHMVGLTPTRFNPSTDEYYSARKYCWEWYKKTIKALRPIDILVVNGDAIDGKGPKSGGTELITTDRNKQIQMAKSVISIAGAKDHYFTCGTEYHTGRDEDFEDQLALAYNKELQNVLKLEIQGVKFNIRHHVAGSSSPVFRLTGAMKEKLWDEIKAIQEGNEKADYIIRSHVHYYGYSEDSLGTVITTPALQLDASKYGERRCTGVTNFGFISFDIKSPEECYFKKWLLKRSPLEKTKYIKVT